MHNIGTNFSKFYGICKELFEKEVDSRKNFQFYPVAPKMNDLEVVALPVVWRHWVLIQKTCYGVN